MKKNSTVFYGVIAAYLFLWSNGSVFMRGKYWLLSWMVIRYLSYWVKSFLFLIMDRLLRDDGGVVIMHDLSFLIRGMLIMEIGHFSFYTSFSSHLYHLISR